MAPIYLGCFKKRRKGDFIVGLFKKSSFLVVFEPFDLPYLYLSRYRLGYSLLPLQLPGGTDWCILIFFPRGLGALVKACTRQFTAFFITPRMEEPFVVYFVLIRFRHFADFFPSLLQGLGCGWRATTLTVRLPLGRPPTPQHSFWSAAPQPSPNVIPFGVFLLMADGIKKIEWV